MTPIQGSSWQIKNSISFPSAPKGTSEALIYTALKDLNAEEQEALRTGGKVPHPSNNNFRGGKILSATNALDILSDNSSISEDSISVDDSEEQNHSNQTSDMDSSAASSSGSGRTSHSSVRRANRRDRNRVSVTFGLSASPKIEPSHNLGGWKISALTKTYGKVVRSAKLLQRGEFRVRLIFKSFQDLLLTVFCLQNKFASYHEQMYVCYPPDGFGLDGINALLKILRK